MKKRLIFYLLFLGLLIYLFYPVIFQNKHFLDEDTSAFFYPAHKMIKIAVTEYKEFPLWNPFRYSGVPTIEDMQTQLFYPFTWIFLLLDTATKIDLLVLIHLILGFVFFYRLLYYNNLSNYSCFTGSLIYIFSGFFAQSFKESNLGIICTVIWLPLIITELIIYFNTKNKIRIITAILGNIMMFLAGHLNFFYISQFIIIIYILFYNNKFSLLKNKLKKRIIIFCIFYILTVTTVLFQLIPMYKMSENSFRVNKSSFSFTTNLSLSPDEFLMFFLKNPFGVDETNFIGPNNTIWLGYTGFIPLILILLILKTNFKNQKLLFLTCLLGIFLALGKYNPLFKYLFYYFPGIKYFRAPSRYLYIYIFSISILSAHTIEKYIFNKNLNLNKLKFLFLYLCFLSGTSIIIFVNYFKQSSENLILYIYKYILNTGHTSPWLKFFNKNGLPSSFNYTITQSILQFIIVTLILIIILFLIKRKNSKPFILFIIFSILIIYELLPLNKQLLNFSLNRFKKYTKNTYLYKNYINQDKNIFRLNTISATGYLEHITHNQREILGRTATIRNDYSKFLGNLRDKSLQWLTVKYSIINPDIKTWVNKNIWTKVLDNDLNNNELWMLKEYNEFVTPAKKIIFKDNYSNDLKELKNIDLKTAVLNSKFQNKFNITKFNTDNINITDIDFNINSFSFNIKTKSPQFLIISELFENDWKCYINNKPAEIYKSNFILRGIYIPKNDKIQKYKIKFVYKPVYFYYILGISITSLFCILFFLLYFIKNSFHQNQISE